MSAEEGHDENIKVLENDRPGNSPLDEDTLEIIGAPRHAQDYRVHNDHIHYKSVDDYEGTDRIVYRICNENGLCGTGTVRITVSD